MAKTRPPEEFDDRVGDFLAEISVVGELSKRECSDFAPLAPPAVKKGMTPSSADYRCLVPSDEVNNDGDSSPQVAYLEIKNLRAPRGINNAFIRIYTRLLAEYPELSRFRIIIKPYSDNHLTDDRRARIEAFLTGLASSPASQTTVLSLPGDVPVEIKVLEGHGGVCMFRGIGGDEPWGPFTNPSALLKKATEKIRDGIRQLSNYPAALRILALNIQSPDATFSNDVGIQTA